MWIPRTKQLLPFSPAALTATGTGEHFSTQVVILGAGPGVRGASNPAMQKVGAENRVLDWLLEAFAGLPEARVSFVGGYDAESIRQAYPQMEFAINPRWRGSGASESLQYARLDTGLPVWVTYADIVYRPDVVKTVSAAARDGTDIVLAVDKTWRHRYERRSTADIRGAEKVVSHAGWIHKIGVEIDVDEADAEFCGLVRLSSRALAEIRSQFQRRDLPVDATLPDLLRRLLSLGLDAKGVDVDGHWAELNAPQDLARFVLGTKAESLERLGPLLTQGRVGDLIKVPVDSWQRQRSAEIDRVQQVFPRIEIIVRSSSHQEDGWAHSAAGAFESVAGVDSSDSTAVGAAVDRVFESYGRAGEGPRAATDRQIAHVLVQAMVADVRMSGVVMTRTPQTQAPYYVISFDSQSQRTDTVTGGIGEIRTVYVQRDSVGGIEGCLKEELGAVIETVRELELLVGHDSLDIEFAVDASGVVHVLQVRPIVAQHVPLAPSDVTVSHALAEAQKQFTALQGPGPFVIGSGNILSVMSDWNPAEIVGPKPRRLADSLYRHVITDEIWAGQRARNGYRDVRPCPLLVNVLGHPYIDVRASFNSFVPAELDDSLATRLVDHYLEGLRAAPHLHDKVEFDLVYTCLGFDHDERAAELSEAGFSADDRLALKNALRKVTQKSIKTCSEDLAQLEHVDDRLRTIALAALDPLTKARALLEETRRFGTPIFANLARCGFVAAIFLRSLQKIGAIDTESSEAFLRTVRTVSSDLQRDAFKVKEGSMSFDELVERYGHLRPGTYDICSSSYAEAAEEHLRPMVQMAVAPIERDSCGDSILLTSHRAAIAEAIDAAQLALSPEDLVAFVRAGIEGREFGKFVFTKGLSAAIDAFGEFAAGLDVPRTDIAHVGVHQLLGFSGVDVGRVRDEVARAIDAGKEAFAMMQAMHLPGCIRDANDLLYFEQERATANFITGKKTRGQLVELSAECAADVNLTDKIVLVTNADPGFDWLFGRKIAGLITMYGGANSHMAVRAAEFGLPAAIGIGAALYNDIKPLDDLCPVVELDCGEKRLHRIT